MARKPREKQEAWLLIKSDDDAARDPDEPDIVKEMTRSAESGRDMDEIAGEQDRTWSSAGKGEVTAKPKRQKKIALDVDDVPKAKAAPLPKFVEPSLPTGADRAPSGSGWVHEIKYDGYRTQIRLDKGEAKLLTRKGLDWTDRFRSIARAAEALPVKSAIIDGEIVVLTDAGVPSFTALVDALKGAGGSFAYYAFDLLHLDGFDLTAAPLVERKEMLRKIVEAAGADGPIRFSDHLDGDGDVIFHHAARLGLEGIISKRASAPYQSGRVKSWLKIRSTLQEPFIIAGFVTSTLDKKGVGALVLAEHVGKKLVASGHVGTGFTAASARELFAKLDPLRTNKAPVEDELAVSKGVKWVEPKLVAEIEYRARSGTGIIRHSVYKGLNEDVPPNKVIRPGNEGAAKTPAAKATAVRLTNPARLLWPEQGVTKQGLADFYTEIADWILPHIVGRPLSLFRCPGGIHEDCFFQKHRWAGIGEALREVKVPIDDEKMLAIDDLDGLLELVQASVLEIHPWGSKVETPELPDRVILDLDPGDGVPWENVVEGARDARDRLAEKGLKSFVKTTGGKGLHVVFPLKPKADWETIKAFAQKIAEEMAAARPDRYVATMAKKVRHGRIYVDYVRNGMGATAVAAYSTRARPGAAVSTPLAWDELGPQIRANHFTVENLPNRLAYLDRDPWEGFFSLSQTLPGGPAERHAKKAPRTAAKRR